MKTMTWILAALLAASTPAAAQGTPSTHADPRAVLAAFASAWSRADAGAIADLFTDAASVVIPGGTVVDGRPAIQAFYAMAFGGGYGGSVTTAEATRTRTISSGAVLVDGTWTITGARTAAGQPRPAEGGVFTAVLTDEDGRWRIAALREHISPPAPRPRAGDGGHQR